MAEFTPTEVTEEILPILQECERRLDYVFKEKTLLLAALTHASGAQHRLASNERLEFLGDAILGAVVSELLFHQFPDLLEGDLTKIKSVVVSRRMCTKVSKSLNLQELLILGKGMASHPTVPPSLLSDVFESLVAAMYLDGGDAASRKFIQTHLDPEIRQVAGGEIGANHKSILQQLVQREHGTTPTYQLVDEKGPDHCKCFKISARVEEQKFHPAWGRNKKEAEQRAAKNALAELDKKPVPYPTE